eukprot:1839711-Rhodomonas_salina.1
MLVPSLSAACLWGLSPYLLVYLQGVSLVLLGLRWLSSWEHRVCHRDLEAECRLLLCEDPVAYLLLDGCKQYLGREEMWGKPHSHIASWLPQRRRENVRNLGGEINLRRYPNPILLPCQEVFEPVPAALDIPH